MLLRSDRDWRITTFREGDEEFGPGYYYAHRDSAITEFGERLTEGSA